METQARQASVRTSAGTSSTTTRQPVSDRQNVSPALDRRTPEIQPGDVIWILPDVKHWHGATATNRMSHIAIPNVLDGKAVDWDGTGQRLARGL